jgi:hypothetical protein
MSLNDFPKLVFVSNKDDAKIQFSLGDNHNLKTAHDLFFFFVDLLIKGIVLLFAQGDEGSRSVVIGDLSAENIELLKRKFANIGVVLTVEAVPNEGDPPKARIMYELSDQAGGDVLENYRMKLVDVACTYFVRFKMMRV